MVKPVAHLYFSITSINNNRSSTMHVSNIFEKIIRYLYDFEIELKLGIPDFNHSALSIIQSGPICDKLQLRKLAQAIHAIGLS
jgi:hypothetical protein